MSTDDGMRIGSRKQLDIRALTESSQRQVIAPTTGDAFASLLEQAVGKSGEVRFSAHAMQRLTEREVTLSDEDKARIGESLDRAGEKGGRQALILMDDLALIASVPNRTVITVSPKSELQDMVFTNIDSAVIASRPSKQDPKPDSGLLL